MNLDKFLSLSIVLLGFIGTIFLLKGVIRIAPDIIGEIGTPKWGFNIAAIENLSIQKADTSTGFIMVVIAFSLQVIKELLSLKQINLPGSYARSFILMIVLCSVLFIVMYSIDKALRTYNRIAAGKAVTKKYINKEFFADDTVRWQAIPKIETYASKLLFFHKKQDEKAKEFIIRLGDYLDLDLKARIEEKENNATS